jgi:uncharacterized protein involved in cysteine biosynthesis
MLTAFARAVAQLSDPAFRRPLVLGLAGAIAIFAGLWAGLWWVLTRTAVFDNTWLDGALDALGGLAAIVLTFLLYPAIAAGVMSLFLDSAADAVEARHYPHLPPARRAGLGEQAWAAARLTGAAVVLNLAALPLYLVPGVNLVVFYGLNGYILGREYFEMVALRRLDPVAMRRLRGDRRLSVLVVGVVIALISTLPVFNIVAPLLAVAAMTHRVQSWLPPMGRSSST